FSKIEPSGGRVYVLYVLDLAEIPTFQARPAVAAEGKAGYASRMSAAIAHRLRLKVAGRPVPLRVVRTALPFPPGQAGLDTTRLEVLLTTPQLEQGRTARLDYADTNFADRIGWKEIVVDQGQGARLLSANAPSRSLSSELLAYPKDLLQSPLDVTR